MMFPRFRVYADFDDKEEAEKFREHFQQTYDAYAATLRTKGFQTERVEFKVTEEREL